MKTKNNFKLTAAFTLAAFVVCVFFSTSAVAQNAKAKKSATTEKQVAPTAEKKADATAKPVEQTQPATPARQETISVKAVPSTPMRITNEVEMQPTPVTPKKD